MGALLTSVFVVAENEAEARTKAAELAKEKGHDVQEVTTALRLSKKGWRVRYSMNRPDTGGGWATEGRATQ